MFGFVKEITKKIEEMSRAEQIKREQRPVRKSVIDRKRMNEEMVIRGEAIRLDMKMYPRTTPRQLKEREEVRHQEKLTQLRVELVQKKAEATTIGI